MEISCGLKRSVEATHRSLKEAPLRPQESRGGDKSLREMTWGLRQVIWGLREVTWALKEVTWGFGWSFLAQGGHFRHHRKPISASREITWGP